MSAAEWVKKFCCAVAGVGVLVAGCAAPQGGSAVAAAPAAPGSVVSSGSALPALSSTDSAPPTTALADDPSAASPASSTAAGLLVEDSPAGDWSANVETGPAGIPSPTGELSAQVSADRVCFRPTSGEKHCGELAPGVTPSFAAFSPDGAHLLLVAGPANSAGVYVFDPADGSARVLGPSGLQEFSVQDSTAGTSPPGWELSSAVWDVDGSSVLLVPRTAEATGVVLDFDLTTGAVSEAIRLDAALINSSPSLWTSDSGIAVVANTGDQVSTLWWGDFESGSVDDIGGFSEPGGSLMLSSADPLGRSVLVCPRRADGRLGATTVVTVGGGQSGKLLDDSLSCAGAVFSADGQYLALTASVAGSYRLLVMETASATRVLSVPLPVAEPSVPPYLTWAGDVVAATDLSGQWSAPSIVATLRR